MQFDLSFEKLIAYDAGETGISLEVVLRLNNLSVVTDAKVDNRLDVLYL